MAYKIYERMSVRQDMWKRKNLENAYEAFEKLGAFDHTIIKLSEHHFRIEGVLDVWPSTKRWYDTRSHAKGEYEDLFTFVMLRFEDREKSTRT